MALTINVNRYFERHSSFFQKGWLSHLSLLSSELFIHLHIYFFNYKSKLRGYMKWIRNSRTEYQCFRMIWKWDSMRNIRFATDTSEREIRKLGREKLRETLSTFIDRRYKRYRMDIMFLLRVTMFTLCL